MKYDSNEGIIGAFKQIVDNDIGYLNSIIVAKDFLNDLADMLYSNKEEVINERKTESHKEA